MPRAGEHLHFRARSWRLGFLYVVTVEYFLGYDQSTGEPSRSLMRGMGRVTLYVEPSK